MEEQLPNILIDGIPFILKEGSLIEFTNPANVINACDLKDEGDFFYLTFDRETKNKVEGMRPYSDLGVSVVRIVLPTDLFSMSNYLRPPVAEDFNRVSREGGWGILLLSETVAKYVATELKNKNISSNDPALKVVVGIILENFRDPKSKMGNNANQKRAKKKGL